MRAATLTFLGEHRRARTEPLTDRLVERIEEGNPGYRWAGVVPHDDLWRSCHDNIVRVLELLASAVEDGVVVDLEDAVYDAARETGRRRAEQGLPLDDVLRSYRIGGRLIWDDIVENGDAILTAHEVREIGTRLWEVIDETSAAVAATYHEHERRLVRADEQQRAELWEGVLGGRARDPGFARDAALVLDVPVNADFLVVAAPTLDLRRADDRLSPYATAWVRRTEGVVGLVALRDDTTTDALEGLRAVASADGVPVGVSAVVAGLAGVEQGFSGALLALRAQGATPGLGVLDERLPEALLLSSPSVAARLVARWVEPIMALPAVEADVLIETVTAWVAAGGSATATAAVVPCHRNTVLNRLRRVEALTGTALTDDAPPVDLDLALRAWRMGPG